MSELTWSFLERLENLLGHPNISSSVQVAGQSFHFHNRGVWREDRLVGLELTFAPSRLSSEELRVCWRDLGFPENEVYVPRVELRAPAPLSG